MMRLLKNQCQMCLRHSVGYKQLTALSKPLRGRGLPSLCVPCFASGTNDENNTLHLHNNGLSQSEQNRLSNRAAHTRAAAAAHLAPQAASGPSISAMYEQFDNFRENEPAEIPEVIGMVHSTESFTAVDGPGVRFLCFLQGCGFRCVFCSNPDTWRFKKGQATSSKDIAKQLKKLLPYLTAGSKQHAETALHSIDGQGHVSEDGPLGGITLSGGEPLLQPYFCAALFQEAHALGLTTCLDTTGQGTLEHNWDVVLPHTDYVLVCIKAVDPTKYKLITGVAQHGVMEFIDELEARAIPYWVRYVYAPGVTDSDKDIEDMTAFAKGKRWMQAVEVLPYHTLGKEKWHQLGLQYPMENQRIPSADETRQFVAKLKVGGMNVLCSVPQDSPQQEALAA